MSRTSLLSICLVASLMVGCKKTAQTPQDASKEAWIPLDERPRRIETSPESLQTRYPGAQAVFAKHGLAFRDLRISQGILPPVVAIELGENKKFRDWMQFQKVVTDLGESTGWKGSLVFWDSTHHVEVEASLERLGQGRGGIRIRDTLGYFAAPNISPFSDGLERVAVSPEDAGVVYRKEEDELPEEGMLTGSDCAGLVEMNGRIFYRVQSWEMPITKGSREGMTHTTGWYLVDASNGTRWKEDMDFGSLPFQGRKSKSKFLREAPDSLNTGWRLLGGSCSDPWSAHLWQYDPRQRRVQNIMLSPVRLEEDLSLSEFGIEGEVVDLVEPAEEENLAAAYFLVRSPDLLQVVRSGGRCGFFERWRVPGASTRFGSNDLIVKESLDGKVRLEISGSSYDLLREDWEDIPSPTDSSSSTPTCDTCETLNTPVVAKPSETPP